MTKQCREAIADYIRANANPPDKFSHQARLYRLAARLGEGEVFDDDVLYAAAWMHDLGVFVGHRPTEVAELATWDHIGYAVSKTPEVLRECGFPPEKIAAVIEAIRTHMPSGEPVSFEGTLLRDADILEQIGAVGILRTVSKVGRDTRFTLFSEAIEVLAKNLAVLPHQLKLPVSRQEAAARVKALEGFLESAHEEAGGIPW